jgi:hypothetical protein
MRSGVAIGDRADDVLFQTLPHRCRPEVRESSRRLAGCAVLAERGDRLLSSLGLVEGNR